MALNKKLLAKNVSEYWEYYVTLNKMLLGKEYIEIFAIFDGTQQETSG